MKTQIFNSIASGAFRILMTSTALLMLMMLGIAASAQTFAPKGGGGGGFDVETGTKLSETVTIEGKVFDLYATSSGSRYIKCKSARTGNSYAVWVGTPTEHKYDGLTVYQSAKGSYSVLKISAKSGNPYAVWLDKE